MQNVDNKIINTQMKFCLTYKMPLAEASFVNERLDTAIKYTAIFPKSKIYSCDFV